MMVHKAYLDAVKLHGEQVRKGSQVPYVIHVLGVAEQLALWNIGREDEPELWAAAMLHDTVEDAGNTIELIRIDYGPVVADWVNLMTFRDRLTDEQPKEYQAAKEQHLTEYRHKPIEVVVLKLADRFRNVKDFAASDRRYAAKYLTRASGLTVLATERREDIERRFGVDAAERIRLDIRQLASELL
jgi:guanosine-3',5'-bis(diphosphate) 3'-pyrophosphohydrolase